MTTKTDELIGVAQEALDAAMAAGADECEVFASEGRQARVDLRNGDIEGAATSAETTWGIRVVRGGALGFATVNRPGEAAAVGEEAVRLARISPPDPLNGLRPAPTTPYASLDGLVDPAVAALEVDELVDLAASLVQRIKDRDGRVRLDSGEVFARVGSQAILTSHGLRAHEEGAVAGGGFFGMAVDGDEVGSFDYDGQYVLARADLATELAAAVDRFVTKTTSALGAGPGVSFRGDVILSPEVVSSFVIDNLVAGLSGKALRLDTSPFRGMLGEAIAVPGFHLVDDPHRAGSVARTAFDREGTPTAPLTLVENGVLRHFLYDVYEARAADTEPTGHALGGASAIPGIGPHALTLRPGDKSFATLCGEGDRALVVSRFSGNCNPVTGEFSGVVKGGFLIENGERRPVNETLIAGNLLELLRNISGISSDTRTLYGSREVPGLRARDVSITAG